MTKAPASPKQPSVLEIDSLRFFRIDPWVSQKLHQNERFLMPGIARSAHADLVLVGTSRTQNISPEQLSSAFGSSAVRLSLSGGYPYETARLLEVALASHPVKRVLVELSIFPDAPHVRNPAAELPRALYAPSYLAVPYYLLSPLSVTMYLDSSKYGFEKLCDYNAWYPARKHLFGAENVRKDACLTPRRTMFAGPARKVEVIEAEYRALFERNPNVRFDLVYTPYHRWLYTPGNIDDVVALHRQLWDMSARYPNVTLHDFAAWDGVAGHAERFCDLGHYDLEADAALLKHIRSEDFSTRKLDWREFEAQLRRYAGDPLDCAPSTPGHDGTRAADATRH